jgi:hypothetical protein
MPRQRLAGEAERADIERPIAGRRGVGKPSGLAQRADQAAARRIDVGFAMPGIPNRPCRPRVQIAREIAMRLIKERPTEKRPIRHAQASR